MQSINLGLRLFLELAALAGFAVFAWQSAEGAWRYLAVTAILCIVMTLWGVFAVPNDPSRSGRAPFPVSGSIRLLLEFVVLFGGAFSHFLNGFVVFTIALTGLIVLHYALSGQRIAWILQQ